MTFKQTAVQVPLIVEGAQARDVEGRLRFVSAPMPLEQYAAQERWWKEVGGIVFAGHGIHTDDRSKALIQGAYLRAMIENDPDKIVGWKTADGFAPLTNAQIMAMAVAVGDHVQACFAKEAEILAGIASKTITTKEQIDAALDALNDD